jgi:hypothetical protein
MECLSCKCEALSSNPSAAIKRKEKVLGSSTTKVVTLMRKYVQRV